MDCLQSIDQLGRGVHDVERNIYGRGAMSRGNRRPEVIRQHGQPQIRSPAR